jgi:hypothetical protein
VLVEMDEAMYKHQGQLVFKTVLLEFLGTSENVMPHVCAIPAYNCGWRVNC